MTWPIHAIPGLIIGVPTVLLTRTKMKWRKKDSLIFVLPWLLWALCFAFGPRAASLSSAMCESLLLGSAVGLSFVALAVLARRFNPDKLRRTLPALVCSIAVLLWAFFPFLGE